MKSYTITLPAGSSCVSVANTLNRWAESCSPIVSKEAVFDKLTGKPISPAEYSGVEALAESKEKLEDYMNSLGIPFVSIEESR